MKSRYFIAVTVVLFVIALFGLRNNNLSAAEIRDDLLTRDAAGEDVRDDVEDELREFVFTRMNASTRIYLAGAHSRAITEVEVASDAAVDGSVYQDAASACDQEGRDPERNARCVQDYVAERTPELATVDLPHEGEYTYVYYSPRWTTDLPGLALLGSVLGLVTAGVLYVRYWLMR